MKIQKLSIRPAVQGMTVAEYLNNIGSTNGYVAILEPCDIHNGDIAVISNQAMLDHLLDIFKWDGNMSFTATLSAQQQDYVDYIFKYYGDNQCNPELDLSNINFFELKSPEELEQYYK